MAGDWIQWEKRLYNKPEILATARVLHLSAGDACLCWMRAWEWADDMTATGHIYGVTGADIDGIVQHPGFAAAAVSVGWMIIEVDGVFFPNYARHNGLSAKKRLMDAQRKRASRKPK